MSPFKSLKLIKHVYNLKYLSKPQRRLGPEFPLLKPWRCHRDGVWVGSPGEAMESRGFGGWVQAGVGGRETQGEDQVPATCLVNRAASLDLSPRSGVRYTGGFYLCFPGF